MSLKDWTLSTSTTTSCHVPSILLMDGGVSTHLETLLHARGLPGSFAHRALWSSSLLLTESGRQTILQGHKDWLTAGSDVLTTVTYQCHFGTSLLDPQQDPLWDILTPLEMAVMMKNGVQLAKQAVAEYNKDDATKTKDHFVVASSGCYGAALADGSEYTGSYPNMNWNGLVEFHTKKAKVLLDAQPEGLAIETIPSVEECGAVCVALRRALAEYSRPNGICCWVSLACKDGATLNEGRPFVDALQTIREHDPRAECVHAIGVNCCDSAHIGSLLELLTLDMALKGPRRGIVIYPNSGEEWDASNEAWREGTGCTDVDKFSDRLMEAVNIVQKTWNEHGGSTPMPKLTIGGCCRNSPETIAALRQRIDEWHRKKKHNA